MVSRICFFLHGMSFTMNGSVPQNMCSSSSAAVAVPSSPSWAFSSLTCDKQTMRCHVTAHYIALRTQMRFAGNKCSLLHLNAFPLDTLRDFIFHPSKQKLISIMEIHLSVWMYFSSTINTLYNSNGKSNGENDLKEWIKIEHTHTHWDRERESENEFKYFMVITLLCKIINS